MITRNRLKILQTYAITLSDQLDLSFDITHYKYYLRVQASDRRCLECIASSPPRQLILSPVASGSSNPKVARIPVLYPLWTRRQNLCTIECEGPSERVGE